MKFTAILSLAALSTAFVLPSEQVLDELVIEDHHSKSWVEEAVSTKNDILSSFRDSFDEVAETSKNAWTKASAKVSEKVKPVKSKLDEAFDTAENAVEGFSADFESWFEDFEHEGSPEHGRPGHGRPGRRPHHPPHHHEPNLTVYQLISESKYTTKFAKLISEYDDLVNVLNTTNANFTVFAPTDKAFEKIPDHAPKPTKEQLLKILEYHVVPGFYPAGRVLTTHTAGTLLKAEHLSDKTEAQRIAFKITLRGLTVNFYSRIVAVNIFATNGVIHGVDSLIIPPPSVITLIDLFPGEFSTLELGLGKTGLLEQLNSTHHAGGTFFAPSNFAFKKLGPKINAFLFSKYGQKYLKALLEYHVVPHNTLYSDAYYKKGESKESIPKGLFHVDLPTLLEDRSLSIDIARYGGFISIKINGFASVAIQDGIAEDGVIHVVRDVLIPPKKLDGAELEHWDGSDLSVEDLQARLEPFVAKGDL